jgi:hypothetical protein
MKFPYLVLICVITFTGCGRLVKVSDKEQVIRQVYAVQLTRSEIFDRALEWCAKKLATVNDSITVKDRDRGMIIGKGTGKYSEYFDFLVDREFSYTLTIDVKDGRYRVTCDNLVVYYDERQLKSSKAEFKFEIAKIKKVLDPLMEDLREYMKKGVTDKVQKKEEEW